MQFKNLTLLIVLLPLFISKLSTSQNLEYLNMRFFEPGAQNISDSVPPDDFISGSNDLLVVLEVLNNTGNSMFPGDTIQVQIQTYTDNDTSSFGAPMILQDTLKDQDTISFVLPGFELPDEPDEEIEVCAYILNNSSFFLGSICRIGKLNLPGIIEVLDLHLLKSGGTFPQDTFKLDSLRGDDLVDVRFTFVNNTNDPIPPNTPLNFSILMLNISDTVFTPETFTLNNELQVRDTLTLIMEDVRIFNENGVISVSMWPLDNDSLGEGLAIKFYEVTEVYNRPEITEILLLEEGGTHPFDILNPDSVKGDDVTDIYFSVENHNSFPVDTDKDLNYELILIENGNSTIVDSKTFNTNIDSGNGTASLVWTGFATPQSIGEYTVLIRYADAHNENEQLDFNITSITGVDELIANSIRMYSGHKEIIIESGDINGESGFTLFDLNGKQILNKRINLTKNNTHRVKTTHISKGVYIMQLTNDRELVKSEKVMLR